MTDVPVQTGGSNVFGGVGEASKIMSQVNQTPTRTRSVPSNQIQRNWGAVSDQALRDPVVITAKGRPRHVLMAFDEYERLKARDRQTYRVEALPDDLAAMLEAGLNDLRVPIEGTSDDSDTIIR